MSKQTSLKLTVQDEDSLQDLSLYHTKSVTIGVSGGRFRIEEKDGKLFISETSGNMLATIGHSSSSIFITSEDF